MQRTPEEAGIDEDQGAVAEGDFKRPASKGVDPEIFDDTDFYESMLKELLEGSSRSGSSFFLVLFVLFFLVLSLCRDF